MRSWSNDLVAGRHFPEAIDLLKFEVQIFPDSGTLDSLGDAYRRSGQTQLAMETYKRALDKSPSDEMAREKLKELENAK
jgi:tetratricopeptide (TPR) repeat protein